MEECKGIIVIVTKIGKYWHKLHQFACRFSIQQDSMKHREKLYSSLLFGNSLVDNKRDQGIWNTRINYIPK